MWEQDRIPEVTIQSLLDKFYEKQQFEKFLGKKFIERVWPDTSFFAFVSYRGFYVNVLRNDNSIFGPHVARLIYRSDDKSCNWIATCQIEGNFFQEETIEEALHYAINFKEFFTDEPNSTVLQ